MVAVGTFDGVHQGHQQILREVAKRAEESGLISVALSFDPHPRQVISPEIPFYSLTTLEEKAELMQTMGIQALAIVRFNARIRRLSYKEFVKKVLVSQLGVKKVIVGYDHAFGFDRHGTTPELTALGKAHGFEIDIMPPVQTEKKVVKSSLIRKLLLAGKVEEANALLGYWYRMTGVVHKMSGFGHKLGFPTANLKFPKGKLIPANGVYSGHVWVRGYPKLCVMNVGVRPTVDGKHHQVEVHVLNFNEGLYHEKLQVDMGHRLRNEKKFSSTLLLKKQIQKDIQSALKQEEKNL